MHSTENDPYEGLNFEHRITAYLANLERDRLELEQTRVAVETINAFALMAIKSLMLVSGAGAIAMLAFVGHLASNPLANKLNDITQLVPSLLSFGIGAMLAAVAAGMAYLSQIALWNCQKNGNNGEICFE